MHKGNRCLPYLPQEPTVQSNSLLRPHSWSVLDLDVERVRTQYAFQCAVHAPIFCTNEYSKPAASMFLTSGTYALVC
jgi:hypothetical protein